MLFIKSKGSAVKSEMREAEPIDKTALFQGLIPSEDGTVIVDAKLAVWRSPIVSNSLGCDFFQVVYTSRYRFFLLSDVPSLQPKIVRQMTPTEVIAWLLHHKFELPAFLPLEDYVE